MASHKSLVWEKDSGGLDKFRAFVFRANDARSMYDSESRWLVPDCSVNADVLSSMGVRVCDLEYD